MKAHRSTSGEATAASGFLLSAHLGTSSGIGGTLSAGGSYLFQVVSGTVTKDFDILKETDGNTIQWRSRLKNIYDGNQPGFEIVSTQRLMVGQVVGRTGAKVARIGGSPVMMPVFIKRLQDDLRSPMHALEFQEAVR